MKTLFDAIKEAGIPFASHESDLYIPDTKETRELLEEYPLNKQNATRFHNQVEGGTWIDVPFAFTPYWEARQKQA